MGYIFFLLCIATGFVFMSLMLPQVFVFMKKSYMGEKIKASSLFVAFPACMVSGMMLMAWPTYILACIFRNKTQPLKYANAIVITAALIFIVAGCLILKKRLLKNLVDTVCRYNHYEALLIGFLLIFSFVLMWETFNIKNDTIGIGISVYSDFSTHLDMIRSFSNGRNFPATYSHFAGEDIKYHFMFQFFVGNLEFLGMRLDHAFNLPSILCFVSVCMLIYALALKLFAKRPVGYLAVFLFLFRSGSALRKYLAGISGTAKEILDTVINNTEFIGSTTNENWGLYNLNVYANQRHLAFGLSVILLAILLMLPNVFFAVRRMSGCSASEYFKKSWLDQDGWMILDVKTAIAVGLLLGMCSFFNGACVIGCLLVLFVLAFICDRRLEYLVVAVISVLLALIQSKVFIWESAFSFRWEPGYLSEIKTFFATADFMYALLGMFVILTGAAFIFNDGWHRYILLAFISPIIFAACFQLTVDTAVNHKYIMMGVMLGDIFIAALIYSLIQKKTVFTRIASVILIVMMTATGIYDFYTVLNRNSLKKGGVMTFSVNDPVTKWVMENSDANDIWLTDWYSLNNVTLGGAMLYYGWPYYAWSAGYDTYAREEEVHAMYEAGTSDKLSALVQKNNIRFIVVDFPARSNEWYYVNEHNIARTYECVYSQGEGDWSFKIYDTQKPINKN